VKMASFVDATKGYYYGGRSDEPHLSAKALDRKCTFEAQTVDTKTSQNALEGKDFFFFR
jgi:hypothetical protein